jgi:hypothetical protein
MVHTRTSKDPILDIPKDLSNMDVAKPHVAMLHLHHLAPPASLEQLLAT